jgi:hypothetical protein
MRIYSDRKQVNSEWNQGRILTAMQAYCQLHPKPRKAKRPDMDTSSCGKINVKLRNDQGVLVAIYGETTRYFYSLTPERIKKHSKKINQPRPVRSTKPNKHGNIHLEKKKNL